MNTAKAQAEASDIAGSTPRHSRRRSGCTPAPTPIWPGREWSSWPPGSTNGPGETRLDLLGRNAAIFAQVVPADRRERPGSDHPRLRQPGRRDDRLTERIAHAEGAAPGSVLGTGTTLDTARFRSLIGMHLEIDAQHVHGYVLGEHGDTEVLGWSSLDIAGLPVEEFAATKRVPWNEQIKADITDRTVHAAYRIIEGKGATYYGIGAEHGPSTGRVPRPGPARHLHGNSHGARVRVLDRRARGGHRGGRRRGAAPAHGNRRDPRHAQERGSAPGVRPATVHLRLVESRAPRGHELSPASACRRQFMTPRWRGAAGSLGDFAAAVTHLGAAIRGFTASGDKRKAAMRRAGVDRGGVDGCEVDDPVEAAGSCRTRVGPGQPVRRRQPGDQGNGRLGLAHVQVGRLAHGMQPLDEAMALACGPAADGDAIGKSVCSFFTACYFAADFARADSGAGVLRQKGIIGPGPGGPIYLKQSLRSVKATLLCELGLSGDADALLTWAIADCEATMPMSSWHPAIALADLRIRQGRLADAEMLLLGKDHRLQALLPTARLHCARGDYELARATAARGLRAIRTDRLRAAELLTGLVDVGIAVGDIDAAAAACADRLTRARRCESSLISRPAPWRSCTAHPSPAMAGKPFAIWRSGTTSSSRRR